MSGVRRGRRKNQGMFPETRQHELLSRERELWERGYRFIAGVDEVGRGPLAGPVMAAAVVLPPDVSLPGVDDSKRVPKRARPGLAEEIRRHALGVAVGVASPREIDRRGIGAATFQAMTRALERLPRGPDFVLVDGRRIPFLPWPQEARPRADSSSLSVAAASIVAKVTRDRLMEKLGERYPQFGFARHKGYGTPEHLERLRQWGPSPWHRRSFQWDRGASLSQVDHKRSRLPRGAAGEAIALRYLTNLGYEILARNFRAAGAEVDLVARDAEEIVFVEVKYRRNSRYGSGPAAVTPQKRRRISRAAAVYLNHRGWGDRRCRFDVVAVGPSGHGSSEPEIRHLKDAFSGAVGSLW